MLASLEVPLQSSVPGRRLVIGVGAGLQGLDVVGGGQAAQSVRAGLVDAAKA